MGPDAVPYDESTIVRFTSMGGLLLDGARL